MKNRREALSDFLKTLSAGLIFAGLVSQPIEAAVNRPDLAEAQQAVERAEAFRHHREAALARLNSLLRDEMELFALTFDSEVFDLGDGTFGFIIDNARGLFETSAPFIGVRASISPHSRLSRDSYQTVYMWYEIHQRDPSRLGSLPAWGDRVTRMWYSGFSVSEETITPFWLWELAYCGRFPRSAPSSIEEYSRRPAEEFSCEPPSQS